jgi:nitrate/TMAO reductase-like tetraheme cytochrome c subunit
MSDDDILESAEPSATPDDAPKRPVELERRSLYRHPLAAVGGSLIASGAFAFVLLSAVDIAAEHENPYRSLVTFVGAPAIFTLGIILFFIAARLQIRKARLAGDDVQFMLRVEPSNPRYMRNLWIFLGLTFVFLAVVGWSGFKAYEATETVGFCGESCHVMDPQNVTYVNGPHARVPCVDCHIGPGGSFWVRSKIDGIRQLVATIMDTYDRPIHTPVHNLRPAQQTCEGCHWPEQFFGQKLTERTYYRTDEANSPWSISLLVNVGGGNPRTGELEGIHWHMLSAKVVEYIASDANRQVIPWVRVTDPETGEVKVFTDPNADIPDPTDPETDLRLFDCMDCHNRPSHAFDPPAISLNLELSKGNISRDLPYVRKVGLELINADYETKQEATAAIASGLLDYYAAEYPQVAASRTIEIDAAIDVMQRIYSDNFFPEQKTDYRERTNNLSHFANNGCFRCHFTDMQTASGERMLSSTCESCHAIVAQGPTDNVLELEDDLAGLKFIHPADIGGVWETVKCSQCHNPASGY